MTDTTDRPATRTAKKTAAKPATEVALISPEQMRHLHGLLRDHGITGDKTVHDYLMTAGVDHESRAHITTLEAARLIADLEAAPVTHAPSVARLTALREKFPDEAVGKLPRSTCSDCSAKHGPRGACERHPNRGTCPVCGNYHNREATMHIDFVGHADVTDRLLHVDPEWTWEPFTAEQLNGIPPTMRTGLWINLTVLGVTRPGYGDAEGGKGPKEAIGDALRNAAMRFGVALDLWAKGDREWAHTEKSGADQHPDVAQPNQPVPENAPPQQPPHSVKLLRRLNDLPEPVAAQVRENWPYPGRGPAALTPDEADLLHDLITDLIADPVTPGPGAAGEQPPG